MLGEVTGAAVAGLERSRSRRPQACGSAPRSPTTVPENRSSTGGFTQTAALPPSGRSLIPRDPPSMLQGTSRTTHWPTIRVRARPGCWSRWPWTQTPACERWWHRAQWMQRGSAAASAPDAAHSRCTARRHGSERDTPYVACVGARSAESRQSREAARRQWWDEREAPLLNAIGHGAASRKVLTELGIIVQAVTAHRRRSDATSAD